MRVAALSFFRHFVLLEEVVVVCVCGGGGGGGGVIGDTVTLSKPVTI